MNQNVEGQKILLDEEQLEQNFRKELNRMFKQIDFNRLEQSCNGAHRGYAKQVFRQMHQAFVQAYGTEEMDSAYQMILSPAVIRAKNTGECVLGLVCLSPQDAGEHWGTIFITKYGPINDSGENETRVEYALGRFVPYDYWYTAKLERDCHVDFEHLPPMVAELLNSCHEPQQLPPRRKTQNKER